MTPIHEIWKAQYHTLCLLFSGGRITAEQFKSQMLKLGFKLGWELEAEVALHAPQGRAQCP